MGVEDIDDAITDLAGRIGRSGYRPGLVEGVAEDWDLRPAFLSRKFTERQGKQPEDWAAPDPMLGLGISHDVIVANRIAFSMEQRVVRVGPSAWRYVEGMIVDPGRGQPLVIQSVFQGAMMAIELGQKQPRKYLIVPTFGSWDAFVEKILAAAPSRLEPEEFARWAAAQPAEAGGIAEPG